ncbi:putative mitochondrial protein AtMg00310 [Apium graveolens]|uniref:putative mitochondrial protein AtMg00310 n=1 Tax=Apium graveolens TaxID=4045 RepID=UPI003D79CA76
MGEADEHCKYLWLPNIIGRNKKAILGFLKEKAHTQIRSWDGKYIARSGKEILVKSVVQALPVYAMNVFLLPIKINRDIEKRLSRFWWNAKQSNGVQINWMPWERLEKHKSAGGMGFRNFKDFNLAMLGKQVWRFLTNPESLVSRLYKARYYVDGDFLNSPLGHNPTFIWRSIVEAKKILRDRVRWRIGTGQDIQITGQPWLLDK